MSETTPPGAPTGAPASDVPGTETPAPAANISESATEDDADHDGADTEAEAKRAAKGIQKRVDELTALRRQAERDRDHWRELAMRQGQQPPQQQQAPPSAADSPAPKPEDYPAGEFDPGYDKARTEWIKASAAAEAERNILQRFQRHQAQAAEQQVTQSFQAGLAKIVETSPDAPSVLDELGKRIHPSVSNLIVEAGADVAYYIATNPEAEGRIRQARTLGAVAREIGRVEERMARERSAPPQLSAAPPPPPRSVRGSGSGPVDYDRMSTEAFIASRNREKFGGKA